MDWRWGEGRRTAIRPFYLDRREDVSGVSGKGVVAIGVVLPSGKCVLEWRSRLRTVTVFESVDQVICIHGHDGRTVLCWGYPPEAGRDSRMPTVREATERLARFWRTAEERWTRF